MSSYPASLNRTPEPLGGYGPQSVIRRLEQSKPDDTQRDFTAFLRQTVRQLNFEQRNIQWKFYERYLTNEKFTQGEQFGRISALDGTYRPRGQTGPADPRKAHNWIRGYVRGMVTQWTLARAELYVRAIPTDQASDIAQGIAEAGNKILDYHQVELLTEEFRQREIMNGAFSGQLWRYTFPVFKDRGKQKPVFEQQDVQTPGMYQCADCGQGGSDEELLEQACPYCGGDNLAVQPGSSMQIPTVVGYEPVYEPEWTCLTVPDYQLKYDRTVLDEKDATWLRWRLRMRPEVVKQELHNWNLAHDRDTTDPATWIDQRLKESTGNDQGYVIQRRGPLGSGERQDIDFINVEHFWLQPCWYANFPPLQTDFVFANGEKIPAGETIINVYPDGLYVLMVTDQPVHMPPPGEDFRDYWLHTPVVLIPGRMEGDGLVDDLITPQKTVNDARALKEYNMKFIAGGGLIYNASAITREGIPSKPFEAGPTKPGVPIDYDVNKAVAAVPRPPLGSEPFAIDKEMREEMEWQTAVFPTSVGMADTGEGAGGTATEANLKNQGARAQRAPELALFATFEAQWGFQLLKQFQKYATDPLYIAFKGENGEQEGDWFKGADLPKTFQVRVRPRSYIPKGEAERRNDWLGAMQTCGGPQGVLTLAQSPQGIRFLKEVEERFNVNLDLAETNLAFRIARSRIEALKQILPAAGQQEQAMGVPGASLAIAMSDPHVAPDQENDPHAQLGQFYEHWVLTDEGQKARIEDPALYAAVTMMKQACKQGLVAQQQEQQMLAIQSQAPQIAMQQAQRDQQSEQQADQSEADRQHKGEMTDKQIQANSEMSARDQAHARAMQADKLASAERVAKQKGVAK